jgi:para-aminobenzoate synthetase/4-amino-4-deoxychorismate lyase
LGDLALSLGGPSRIRLLVDKMGEIILQSFPLEPVSQYRVVRVGLATKPVSADNIWLYHKTTNRQEYEKARASRPEADEVILWNEAGEITEGTISNIVVDLGGVLFTPPVNCGLLNGTFRQYLVQNGKIHERRISITDLHNNRKIYLINSVRHWQEAKIIEVQHLKEGEK